MAVSTWQCKSRTDEMRWHEWKNYAKALPQCTGLIPLSPTPLNVEVVNQWELGRQSHSSITV